MTTHTPLPPEIWERTPPEAQASILYLEARVAALETTVQDVMERVHQDSRTSSRPPSSDPPHSQRQRRHRQPSGHRPGGQPGPHGQTRTLLPVAEVDEVIALKPTSCARCHQLLDGDDPQPRRHQVCEITPIRPVVLAYQLQQLTCPACGRRPARHGPPGCPQGGMVRGHKRSQRFLRGRSTYGAKAVLALTVRRVRALLNR